MKDKLKNLYKAISPRYETVNLEYKVNVKPAFNKGSKIFDRMAQLIEENRSVYEENLSFFLTLNDAIQGIKPTEKETDASLPGWNNGFLPGLDIVALYGVLAKYKPAKYIEIGSGNSTKVARKSIQDNGLKTEIISIDPYPRAEIDALADKVIRMPFEDLDSYDDILNGLEENDVLFIDNSHRVLPNSDAAVCFLELLPFLKKGVIVHIHDIYLPFDYPQFMCDRFYNEQYMLTAFVVSNPQRYKTILPNFFISEDAALKERIAPIWNHENLKGVEQHGGSFWFQIN